MSIELYKISVRIALENQLSAGLQSMGHDLQRTQVIVERLNSTLAKMAIPQLGNFGASMNAQLQKSVDHATKLHRKMAEIGALNGPGFAATAHAMPHAMPTPPPMPPHGGAGGAGGSGGSGGSGGAGAGGGLGSTVATTAAGFGLSRATLPIAAVAGAAYGTHALYESAKAMDKEVNRFAMYGLGDKVNAEALHFAKGMDIVGVTLTDKIKLFREAQGVFRESGHEGPAALEGAKLAAPMLAKIHFASAALDDESKARMKHSSMAMLRWVEMSGGLASPEKFNQLADMGWRITQSSGGNVNWEQLRQFQATAGVAAMGIGAETLAALEPIIGELKGGRAGTGLRTAFNRLNGVVKLPNQIAQMLAESGVWDATKIEWNQAGGIKKFTGNPFVNAELFQKAPHEFYEKIMLPMYAKTGMNDDERARNNQLIFGSTGGQLFSLIDKQRATIHNSVEATRKFSGVDESVKRAGQTLSGKEEQFTAAWADFKTTFGTAAVPAFTGVLQSGTAFLKGIIAATEFLSKLPIFNASTQPQAIAAQNDRQQKALGFVTQQLAGYDLTKTDVLSSKRVQGLLEQQAAIKKSLGATTLAIQENPNKTAVYAQQGIISGNTGAGGGRGQSNVVQEAVRVQVAQAQAVRTVQPVAPMLTVTAKQAQAPAVQAVAARATAPAVAAVTVTAKQAQAPAAAIVAAQPRQTVQPAVQAVAARATAPATAAIATQPRQTVQGAPTSPTSQASPYVRPSTSNVTVTVNNKIDERGLATMVTKHQTREATRPGMGAPAFDPSMGIAPVGLGKVN